MPWGSRLMAASGYNPIEMARFFEKLNASGGQHLQILSDHPNPGNREVAIQAENENPANASVRLREPASSHE